MAIDLGGEEPQSDETNVTPEAISQPLPVAYLHRDLSTQNQVGILLSITQGMGVLLLTPSRLTGGNLPVEIDGLPRGGKDAAEVVLIQACNRLYDILSDVSRWTPEFQLALEKKMAEDHTQRTKLLTTQSAALEAETKKSKAQEAAALEVSSPHFQYKPTLARRPDGSWIVYLGNPTDPESFLYGAGRSPREAQRDFDRQFDGALPQSLTDWLHHRVADIDAGVETTEPFPKIYEKPNMDGTGNLDAEADAGDGK